MKCVLDVVSLFQMNAQPGAHEYLRLTDIIVVSGFLVLIAYGFIGTDSIYVTARMVDN